MTGAVHERPLALVEDPQRVHLALSPVRQRVLQALQQPSSATQIADELGLTRQQVNYHVRTLERAGLVELVEERRRRGCTERIVRAVAGAFVVDPAVIQPPIAHAQVGDRFAAEHLVATASAIVRDVCRMQAAADRRQRRLMTFTLETDVAFARPADVEAFTTELADALATLVQSASPCRVVASTASSSAAIRHPAATIRRISKP